MSDLELIAGCLKGEKLCWDAFVERFSSLVWWAVNRSLDRQNLKPDSELANDLFQSVFEKLIEKGELGKLRQAGSIRKFLVVLTMRLASDRIKMVSRLNKRELPLDPEFDAAAETRQETTLLSCAEILDGLSKKERRCLEMCYLQGMTHSEIADSLNMNADTVSSIIRRSKEKLRSKLDAGEKDFG